MFFFNICVIISAYHDYIERGGWELKHVGWELLAKAPMDPVELLSQGTFTLILITYIMYLL